MTKAARSVLVFGLYLVSLGVGLILIPNMLLSLFAVAHTNEIWIHVVGMLIFFLGVYYIAAARGNWTAFIALTVPVRASVIAFFGAFVILLGAPRALLLFGVVDLVFAIWTWSLLRASTTGAPDRAAQSDSQQDAAR